MTPLTLYTSMQVQLIQTECRTHRRHWHKRMHAATHGGVKDNWTRTHARTQASLTRTNARRRDWHVRTEALCMRPRRRHWHASMHARTHGGVIGTVTCSHVGVTDISLLPVPFLFFLFYLLCVVKLRSYLFPFLFSCFPFDFPTGDMKHIFIQNSHLLPLASFLFSDKTTWSHP